MIVVGWVIDKNLNEEIKKNCLKYFKMKMNK